MRGVKSVVLGASLVAVGVTATGGSGAAAENGNVGINVLLGVAATDAVLEDLARHGQVLDVIPEIGGVTLRARTSELAAIQALPYVDGANIDAERFAASTDGVSVPDFHAGADDWNLDAVNVTDAGQGRTVAYDGEGVYVAVLDTGLVHDWRAYFPEERIDAGHARAFGGGGGDRGTVSEQPDKWEHDTNSHGTEVTSVILGFRYSGTGTLPGSFNGVAPKATVIPVKVIDNNANADQMWSSVLTRGLLYVTNLKVSGALGSAPLVVNMSLGGTAPDYVERAAIDYAVAHGVVIVAGAANDGASGMRYPGAYAPVISVANTGWTGMFPGDDPTRIAWALRDVPEHDPAPFFISPDSGRELAGQDLDVAAPGFAIPVARSENGQVDYSFFVGTSAATPHVAGIAALMLQKNPTLSAGQVEDILESTAMSLPPGSATVTFPGIGPGNPPTWGDFGNVYFFDATVSWGADATGHGLVQADAALAATPSH